MKPKDIRKIDVVDQKKKLEELQKKQKELRFNKARGELKNPLEKQAIKRDIARILTIMREKSK